MVKKLFMRLETYIYFISVSSHSRKDKVGTTSILRGFVRMVTEDKKKAMRYYKFSTTC